jgi:TRAP-type C4-dicarboxylate transport system permease small subunit
MLRSGLDKLYMASGYVACLFLALIGVTIILQIVGRYLNFAFDATEVSGFAMAASTFLGLAYTLRSSAHIRVNLLVSRFGATGKRAAEIWCTGVATLAGLYFTWYAAAMAIESYAFGDVSPGLMAVPIWIPQVPMVLGLAILTIAFMDELAAVLRGKQPDFQDAEAASLGPIEPEPTAGTPIEAASAALIR